MHIEPDALLHTLQNLPHQPGVYHYFDASGRLLYVGKAKNLSHRVKSYFRFTPQLSPNPTLSTRILKMIRETVSMHYIVVNSEHDALILENSLIKQLKPKYNILLRDDKTYPYIYIDNSEPYPRFEITRKVLEGKHVDYYGPYSSGARDLLDSIYELFTLVQKASCLKGKKACLFYQLGKCLAPCEHEVDPKKYADIVSQARYMLQNRKELADALHQRMMHYAKQLRFEEAQVLRDRIERILKMESVSHIDLADNSNYDIFALASNEHKIAIVRLFMRQGKIVSSSHDVVSKKESFDRDEAYERLLLEYYKNDKPPVIAPILLAHPFETMPLVSDHLSQLFEQRAHLFIPQRGDRKRLIDLALQNAQSLLDNTPKERYDTDAAAIASLCALENLPEHIEVFDNSHMSAQAPVGAMITCKRGVFDKSAYRHYHLESRDEYAQMRETLTRRIESFPKNPPPDLWILDGGATLLALAQELLSSSGTYCDLIAISKEKIDAKAHRAKGRARDIIHTTHGPITLPSDDKRLQWVQRLRDEAHRFAVSFHQKTKLKHDQESHLLTLKGISEAKVKKLINYFGTFEAVRQASESEIAACLNTKDAKIIKNLYN
ncbi:MAG: excinuclease ABC subunit UvrC [Campylobacterales bacterium]|nr:excinuclease ABC subunit UvrC [Campylobacterales bacterium]